MSRSTTTTTTHILLKYSRSYPSVADQVSSKGPSSEWQHYVNPVMRLVLDVKKSAQGELESIQLRILWSMNSGTDLMDVDQRDIVFEDVDLLSFSNSASQQSQQLTNQGLPLKAVYRDAVVGIRYLHRGGSSTTSNAIFRRFQITFQSPSAALQFIDAIRYVCPCKLNPAPVPPCPRPMQQTAGNRTQVHDVPNTYPAPPLSNAATYGQLSRTQTAFDIPSIAPMPSTTSNAVLAPPRRIELLPVSFPSCDLDNISRPTISSSVLPSSSAGISRNVWDVEAPQATQPSGTIQTAADANAELLPGVSHTDPCSRRDACDTRLGQTRILNSQVHSQETPHDPFIAHLRESTKLYDLSRADLEKLVGQVVQEEGFLKLLENLDSMWKIMGLLPR